MLTQLLLLIVYLLIKLQMKIMPYVLSLLGNLIMMPELYKCKILYHEVKLVISQTRKKFHKYYVNEFMFYLSYGSSDNIFTNLDVELVKCTLLLNRLLVLQIYCCVVGVNIVATEQRLWVWYWLCAEYSEGAVDSRTGKVYIVVKQTAGVTDILLCYWC